MSLKEKLVTVISSVARVKKTGYNKHQSYSYATESDLLDGIRDALAENKVLVLTSSEVTDVREVVGKEGRVSFLTTVKTTHTIMDAESNESFTVTSVGSGHDTLDKSVFKAITGSCKYFWMKTFMISTGDDPEDDSNEPVKPVITKTSGFSKPPVTTTPTTAPAPAPKPAAKAAVSPNFTKKVDNKPKAEPTNYEDNIEETTEDVAF